MPGIKLDERGFAFLSSLADLLVLLLLLPLIVLFYSFALSFSEALDPKKLEWQLFAGEMRAYFHQIDSIELINSGGGVRVIQKGEEFDIESYPGLVRKQKFRQGHETMLTGVESCTFAIDGTKLTVRAKFLNGSTEEAEYVLTGS